MRNVVFVFSHHITDYNLFRNATHELLKHNIDVFIFVLRRGRLPKIAKQEVDSRIHVIPISSWKHTMIGKIFVTHLLSFISTLFYAIKHKPKVSLSPGNFPNDLSALITGAKVLQFSDDIELSFSLFLESFVATEKYVPADWHKRKKTMIYKPYTKQGAYLSKKYFSPSKSVLNEYNLKEKGYIFVREVTTKSANYRNQKEFLISTISKRFPKDYQVVMSLEDKSVRHLYPDNWIILQEPVSDINSLMYYSAALVSSGDSVAREGAVLGVPSLYCGIRDMLVNQELIKLGALKKVDVNSVPEELEKITMMPDPIAYQETMRDKVNDIYIEITDFMVERVLHYIK